MLTSLAARGYRSAGYSDVDANEKHLVLRHDLDMSIDAAVPVAQIESDLGMHATYFVLIRSEFYNPFSPECREGLRTITACGHEIGLHFDAANYPSDLDTLDTSAAWECGLLETLTGLPVRVISFHRPAKELLGLDRTIAGRDHAYQARYFAEIGYCSDSRGDWHHGHPLDHQALATGTALQLLTHPLWWTGVGRGAQDRVAAYAEARSNFLKQELARHCTAYTPPANLGSPEIVRNTRPKA